MYRYRQEIAKDVDDLYSNDLRDCLNDIYDIVEDTNKEFDINKVIKANELYNENHDNIKKLYDLLEDLGSVVDEEYDDIEHIIDDWESEVHPVVAPYDDDTPDEVINSYDYESDVKRYFDDVENAFDSIDIITYNFDRNIWQDKLEETFDAFVDLIDKLESGFNCTMSDWWNYNV